MKQDGKKFNPADFEDKWQSKWESDKVFSPNLDEAKKPYYTLMMFPYPSAEGMHVGNMYAHTGADIHGRFRRMQGFDVFEPIGLDGFGIHSENYAMKVGRHPKDQAEISAKNFYRQMRATGSGFDWQRTLETYSPDYYKWTQWLFTEMFKAGLAYKEKAVVNYCPSCKTVLSDEQVIAGECERCGSIVEKKELEQWFFRITNYAGRLLDNIPNLDWTEKVKIAQTNWIGRSRGALITFPIAEFRLPNGEKPNFVLLHGFNSSPERNFLPWIKEQLEKQGYGVQIPALPNTDNPTEDEQVAYVIENVTLDENTILIGHSLGAVLTLKVLEQSELAVAQTVLIGGFVEPVFIDGKDRPYIKHFNWNFDWERIQSKAGKITVLHDKKDPVLSQDQACLLAKSLEAKLQVVTAQEGHFRAKTEPAILKTLIPSLEVFTTRPDTLFGATFMVVAPEHPIVNDIIGLELIMDSHIRDAVKKYVEQAANKTENERIADDKEKTGVFSGLYVINLANGEKIPVWIADYVVSGYGTGAIMAVPAHDERDNAFAQQFSLPIKTVIQPDKAAEYDEQFVYVGHGLLQNSGELNGYHSLDDTDKILEYISGVGIGEAEEQYHLRDWLISRQRYWGPPIPMIYCENCAKQGKSWFDTKEAEESELRMRNKELSGQDHNSSVMGWYPVPEGDLPVALPDIEDFRPMGEGASPLANHPDFYETLCPGCGSPAKRETDVSDTFLDSAWYFLRYLATDWDDLPLPSVALGQSLMKRAENDQEIENGKLKIENSQKRSRYLPVTIYIGGAEHSVLHLLYARFVTMVLHDLGYLDAEEPFSKFYAHGLLIKEGAKMSKSKGNVIVPDAYIEKYGADTLRSYLMFLGPFAQGGDFYDSGIEGMFRFLRRVWYLLTQRATIGEEELRITRARHKTIAGVTHDLEDFGYNTAIAKIMEFYNTITDGKSETDEIVLSRETVASFLQMLAPFAPHMTEELWQPFMTQESRVENNVEKNQTSFQSIHHSSWPKYDESLIQDTSVQVVVQVNGKRRAEIAILREKLTDQDSIEREARELVAKYLTDPVKRVVYVPGKILNFVTN